MSRPAALNLGVEAEVMMTMDRLND